MNRIMDSELNIFGRIAFFLFVMTGFLFFNQYLMSAVFNKDANFFLCLVASGFIFIVGLVAIGLALFIPILLARAIGWIVTGDWNNGVDDAIITAIVTALKFAYLAVFGNWDRRFWRKEKEE